MFHYYRQFGIFVVWHSIPALRFCSIKMETNLSLFSFGVYPIEN